MDRLLCGDVGFGKTEAAVRAAATAVLAGYWTLLRGIGGLRKLFSS